MAEVSDDSLVTPKKDELDDGNMNRGSARNQDSLSNGRNTGTSNLRASVGSYRGGQSYLRSSADKLESASGSKKVVPHYLRASTGSCHDLCKFGKQHSDESKARKPFRKRIAKLSPVQIPVEILVAGSKKKGEVVLGGAKKEVVTGDEKMEVVVTVDKKKEEMVVGGEKKEEAISGGEKKEEAISGGEKKEEAVSGGEKKEEAVSGGEKKEEVVSGDETKEEVINRGPSIDAKVHSNGREPSLDTKSYPSKPKTSLSKKKATKLKPSTYTNNCSPSVPSPNSKSDLLKPILSIYSSKQNDSSGSKTLLLKCKSSSAKKSPSVDPPEIVKSVLFPYTEVEDSVKQGSLADDKLLRTEKKATSVAKQRSSPVKLKPVMVKPSSAPDDSDGMNGKGRSNNNAQTSRKLMTAKASAKKILTPPSATLPSKLPFHLKNTTLINSGKRGNLKLVSPLKDRNMIRRVNTKASKSEKVTEKTLHVIGVETENSVSESIPGDNVISSPQSPLSAESSSHGKSLSLSSHEDDNSDSEESAVETEKLISKKSLKTGKEAPVKENSKKVMRKNGVVVPEDKHVSPVKVKFRMGKVVELQSDNNTPRKLRFRRARVLGVEEGKGDLRRKLTKKAGVTSDTAATGVSSQKVVLKHQDVQGKKDAQGLLNNVIEETASKLVESRKSKVKALVGAFETVISLQESKPSTQIVS